MSFTATAQRHAFRRPRRHSSSSVSSTVFRPAESFGSGDETTAPEGACRDGSSRHIRIRSFTRSIGSGRDAVRCRPRRTEPASASPGDRPSCLAAVERLARSAHDEGRCSFTSRLPLRNIDRIRPQLPVRKSRSGTHPPGETPQKATVRVSMAGGAMPDPHRPGLARRQDAARQANARYGKPPRQFIEDRG